MRQISIFVSFFLLFSPAFAVLEISNAQPKVGAEQWRQVLDSAWQGIKRRNIDAYTTGLVHRPKSETPGDAVSEGVGYGMLLALFANDQSYFDKIYKAGKQYNLNACKNWHANKNGSLAGSGSASDADEDIAAALVLADKLVQKGKWQNTGNNYGTEAKSAVDCVRGQLSSNGALKPGSGWGWDIYNPGYFAPAWYRIFKTIDANNSTTWDGAVRRSYELLAMNPGFSKGLVPDWVDGNAQVLNNGPGYNAFLKGQAFFKDAIRMLWRVANDVIWFPNEHPENSTGKTYLKNALTFITGKGGPSAANFYQMNGELVPNDRWEEFNDQSNRNTWRYRQEHSHLTVGQWLLVPLAVGSDDDKKAWSKKMAEFYDWENKVDFFGNAVDPTGGLEDTLHNEMYFDQFLAWFGVSLMSGTWVNVISLLDSPVGNTEGITEQPFAPPKEPDPEPPEPIIAKTVRFDLQIRQSRGSLRLRSTSDVVWKINNLQGKFLFSSNLREAVWNTGNLKGAVIVSATSGSNMEKKLLVIR